MTQRIITKSANINVMVRAAQKAARSLLHDFNEVEQLQVVTKGLGDFVSTADKSAEKIIVAELKKARPDYGFLLEEGGEIKGTDEKFRFIVDPLDGTTNFLHGIPHFAISIGLQYMDEIIAGVIYDPAKDELFWAEKGQGAFLNSRRLRVSGRKKLDESLFATGIPFGDHGDREQFVRDLNKIMPLVAGVRRMGASSLDLAYVAAGRYECYFEEHIYPWDIAAGLLMVREAGGFVRELRSVGMDMLNKRSILAMNAGIKDFAQKIFA